MSGGSGGPYHVVGNSRNGHNKLNNPINETAATQLGVLQVSGADAQNFLNGQLSNDVIALDDAHAQKTSLSNAQGRLLAVFLAVRNDPDVLLVTPRALIAQLVEHLSRYVLRARVTLSISDLSVSGTWGAVAGTRVAGKDRFGVQREAGSIHIALSDSNQRAITLGQDGGSTESTAAWRLQEIAAGDAWIYPETSGQFVAQMLNLDLVDAISFKKGCYTGQEIIARLEHRGRVRRRMVRFSTNSAIDAVPGDPIYTNDKKTGAIVDAVSCASHSELLAVIQVSHWPGPFALQVNGAPLTAEPLPYRVPET